MHNEPGASGNSYQCCFQQLHCGLGSACTNVHFEMCMLSHLEGPTITAWKRLAHIQDDWRLWIAMFLNYFLYFWVYNIITLFTHFPFLQYVYLLALFQSHDLFWLIVDMYMCVCVCIKSIYAKHNIHIYVYITHI